MGRIFAGIVLILVSFYAGSIFTSKYMTQNPQLPDHLSPTQFSQISKFGKYKLIDVRTAEEYAAGHLANSTQIDYYQPQPFSEFISSLDVNGYYLIYCRTGKRSGVVLNLMKEKGFKHVSDLDGGFNAWIQAGLQTEK